MKSSKNSLKFSLNLADSPFSSSLALSLLNNAITYGYLESYNPIVNPSLLLPGSIATTYLYPSGNFKFNLFFAFTIGGIARYSIPPSMSCLFLNSSIDGSYRSRFLYLNSPVPPVLKNIFDNIFIPLC